MNKIHIGQSCILLVNAAGAPVSKPRSIVITLLGLKAMITRGAGPGIIDPMNKTPAAAQYWAEYKPKLDHAGN